MEAAWHQEAEEKGLVPVIFAPKAMEPVKISENEWEKKGRRTGRETHRRGIDRHGDR